LTEKALSGVRPAVKCGLFSLPPKIVAVLFLAASIITYTRAA
jgi:hypothetical protein